MLADLEQADSYLMSSPLFQARFAESLACLLIDGLDHNLTAEMKSSQPNSGLGRVHKVESFIQDHLSEPLTLGALAEVVCVTERALQKDFRRYRGTSPMVHLREKRFEAIYNALCTATDTTTVAAVAGRFGIVSLSRFSSGYRDYIGELPSQTLAQGRRSRNPVGDLPPFRAQALKRSR